MIIRSNYKKIKELRITLWKIEYKKLKKLKNKSLKGRINSSWFYDKLKKNWSIIKLIGNR